MIGNFIVHLVMKQVFLIRKSVKNRLFRAVLKKTRRHSLVVFNDMKIRLNLLNFHFCCLFLIWILKMCWKWVTIYLDIKELKKSLIWTLFALQIFVNISQKEKLFKIPAWKKWRYFFLFKVSYLKLGCFGWEMNTKILID